MGGPRSKATPEEISTLFHTEEPFKALAKRIGMSPNKVAFLPEHCLLD